MRSIGLLILAALVLLASVLAPGPASRAMPLAQATPNYPVACGTGTNQFSPGALRCWNPWPDANTNLKGLGLYGQPYYEYYQIYAGTFIVPDVTWTITQVQMFVSTNAGNSVPIWLEIYDAPNIATLGTRVYQSGDVKAQVPASATGSYGNIFVPPVHVDIAPALTLLAGHKYHVLWASADDGWTLPYQVGMTRHSGQWPMPYPAWSPNNGYECWDTECAKSLDGQAVPIALYGSADEPDPATATPTATPTASLTPNPSATLSGPDKTATVVAGYTATPTLTPSPTSIPTATPTASPTPRPTATAGPGPARLTVFWRDQWPGWRGDFPISGTVTLRSPEGVVMDTLTYPDVGSGNGYAASAWTYPGGAWWAFAPSPGWGGGH